METKKNPKSDLDSKRNLFFTIGLLISFGLTITAFEWKTNGPFTPIDVYEIKQDFPEEIEVHVTKHKEPEPPKPKTIPQEVVEVKEDHLADDLSEFDFDTEMTEKVPEIEIEEPKKEETDVIHDIVEFSPEPEGGFESFYAFVGKELKYPAKARRMGIEGRVFVQFVVDENGNISTIEVIKGIGAGCDEEAKRVMALAPKWIPGKQRGRAVKVRMVIPILFRLN